MPHVDGNDDGVGYGVSGLSYSGGYGVTGSSLGGTGVRGGSLGGYGMYGQSDRSVGVYGLSDSDVGVFGQSNSGDGLRGYSYSDYGYGVYGRSFSDSGYGVFGESDDGYGVGGYSDHTGVRGESDNGIGVEGFSEEGGTGVYGHTYRGVGVYGYSNSRYGVIGDTYNGIALYGTSQKSSGYAAYLDGRVYIRGPLHKPGGSFKIDHPLDPVNKYLSHSFVESPDMKNVYDGVVALDDKGEAVIDLPDWFAVLNKDFRYQITAIGAPGPNLYIAQEISEVTATTNYSINNNNTSSFKIAGGTSAMKVSWQITGIRKDPWANAHRIEVEQDKPDKERGYYLHPDLYDQPEEKGISQLLFPKEKQELLINKKNKPKL